MNDHTVEIIDLKGLKCPLPVLKARKAMLSCATGEKRWFETTDPLAIIDMPAFCQENGHMLVEVQELEDCNRFLIEKADEG